MPDHQRTGLERMCRHCGAIDKRRLGLCTVCEMAVCESCGDVQHIRGEKKIMHHSCLKDEGGGFSMIKFVK